MNWNSKATCDAFAYVRNLFDLRSVSNNNNRRKSKSVKSISGSPQNMGNCSKSRKNSSKNWNMAFGHCVDHRLPDLRQHQCDTHRQTYAPNLRTTESSRVYIWLRINKDREVRMCEYLKSRERRTSRATPAPDWSIRFTEPVESES